MQEVKNGDTVKVHYNGRLTSGEIFDSSEGREPLEFKVGEGSVIRGFDEGVMGMKVGDKKTVEIEVEDAYGPINPDMVVEFPIDRFPEDLEPEVGMPLTMSNEAGENFRVTITEIKDDTVILDANHPLAGEDLIFDIELVEITGTKPLIIIP